MAISSVSRTASGSEWPSSDASEFVLDDVVTERRSDVVVVFSRSVGCRATTPSAGFRDVIDETGVPTFRQLTVNDNVMHPTTNQIGRRRINRDPVADSIGSGA